MTEKTITYNKLFSTLEKQARKLAKEVAAGGLLPGRGRCIDDDGEPICSIGHLIVRSLGTSKDNRRDALMPDTAFRKALKGNFSVEAKNSNRAWQLLFSSNEMSHLMRVNDDATRDLTSKDRKESVVQALAAVADLCESVTSKVLPALNLTGKRM